MSRSSSESEDETNNDSDQGFDFAACMARLTSCQADVVHRDQRRVWMEQVEEMLRTDASVREALTQWKDYQCPAKLGYGRLARLFAVALLSGSDSGETEKDTLLSLWQGLTLSLGRTVSCSDSKIREYAKSLEKTISWNPLREIATVDGNEKADHVVPSIVLGALMDRFQQQRSNNSNNNTDDTMKNNVWLDELLSYSMRHFEPVPLARAWLSNDVDMNSQVWSETVLPALLIKLKSHPDKALETIPSWLEAAAPGVLPLPTEEWQSVVLKQVQSNKEENRILVHSLVRVWATNTKARGAVAWSNALVQCKVVLAPARLDLLNSVIQLANTVSVSSKKAAEKMEVPKSFVEALVALTTKETTHKEAAWQALVAWFMALRTIDSNDKDVATVMEALASASLKSSDAATFVMSALIHFESVIKTRKQIATDLWSLGAWGKAMQKIVESANVKKPDATLYALYWSLLYYSTKADKYPAWINKILNASSSVLYTNTNVANSSVVAHCLALAHEKIGSSFLMEKTSSIKALAFCVVSPHQERAQHYLILSSIEQILKVGGTETNKLSQSFADSLWDQVEEVHLEREAWQIKLNATRQARESESRPAGAAQVERISWNLIRQAARLLISHAFKNEKLWVLLHSGSTLRTVGPQRKSLVKIAKEQLVRLTNSDLASRLFEMKDVSETCHRALMSLWTTFGLVTAADLEDSEEAGGEISSGSAANVAQDLVKVAVDHLSTNSDEALLSVYTLTDDDVALFQSPDGIPFRVKTASESVTEKKKRLSEEEEWEEQLKKELAAKKKNAVASSDSKGPTALTSEEKALVENQHAERKTIQTKLVRLRRNLEAIQSLCLSDIEVGNSALPTLGKAVLSIAVSRCPILDSLFAYRIQAHRVLQLVATCVYEIEEKFAVDIAQALLLSTRSKQGPEPTIEAVPLPSPCASAAIVLQEVDDFGDTLSGGSFLFVFPILRAALLGPRSTPGCESALEILGRHTDLLYGEEFDPVVGGLRKEMVVTVLELLKHDRAQAYQNPTAFEVLVKCYKSDESNGDGRAISASHLSPLVDERGALGSKNCRTGSMMALAEIASSNGMLVKQNPLVDNRVWVNCFDKDDDISSEAQKTWLILHPSVDGSLSSPTPPLYAVMLPLLSFKDESIAAAAAKAFAHALGEHAGSVQRNLESLCRSYIEAFPTLDKPKSAADLLPSVGRTALPVPKKKPLSIGLPKKKSVSKTPAGLVGIGKPKIGQKKKSSAAAKALLKPKVERTLDQDALANQFQTSELSSESAVAEKDSPSKISTRLGVLRTLQSTTTSSVKMEMKKDAMQQLTSFLISFGIAEIDENVKTSARNTFRDIIATYGGSEEAVAFLLPQLESVLKTGIADETSLGDLPSAKVPRDVEASDRRKEGAVVALGSIALHLKGPENFEKIDSTVDMLLAALQTPSEDVQASVADALTKLMKKGQTQDRIESIVVNLLQNCLHGESLAVRRGAAYGLSSAVKGSGIGSLKKLDVVKSLENAFESGSSNSKEGALFAIELLSGRLGLLFEPYVIVLLPSLLKSFSDGSDYVRNAASHTASLIMSKLSAHGVKLVTPAVLAAFNDPAWRTKQASIHMLGAMSHLAPKQLALSLPKIIPTLIEAFGDTHPKVKASAQEALDEISTVIKNPEIKSISHSLLKALTDPADHTQPALEELIGTEFLHSIDAPSLALIVPILHRGLRDRGATVKRMGGLITGNICTMINDPRDFVPYIPTLLPDLQVSLLDPIPDVRGTAAKALGSLTRSLGDQILPELQPWLVMKLRDDSCSSAERSGAAQGLTEVLIASGSDMVDDTMKTEILPLRSHPDPSTREGVLWMLTFLPPALGQGFTPLIDVSLPALVGGLSDDSEPVREVAMRAGRVLIRSHGKVHVDKILPSLEAGLQDDDHRIRVASLSLLGDLLSMIGGTNVVRGDGDTQDDIRRAEKAQAQIALVLGSETRKRVLSELYLARSDSVYMVRSNALQVWKTVVAVTARTLRDILPVLVSRIIEGLASGHSDRTVVAGQCLGDVVSKLGDSVLPQIMPVLRDTLHSGDEKTKLGVCVGLNEVIKCSTKDQVIKYIDIIVKVVQDALSDDDEAVRKMAASSFQSLHSMVGSRAFDEVVPSIMVALEHEENETSRARALNGLVGILSVRSRELLPYVVPRMIQRPITINHAQALSGIAEVTGKYIFYHFSQIIPALLEELCEIGEDEEMAAKLRDALSSICFHVDEAGVNILISEIASKCPNDKSAMRRESCLLFGVLVTQRADKKDFYDHLPVVLRELLYRLNDDNIEVVKASNTAFTALSKHVPAEELVKHIEFMRNLLASMVSDARRRKGGVGDGEFLLPGFNIPKGLDPLLPIYQRGILYGTPTIREVSASGLGEVLNITSSKFLAGPLIVKMTGPLLRIVGDRNPSNVKVAILKTLGLILVKGGSALRAFVPQFQTTFVKALSDPSRQVRVEAIEALSLLMPLSTRVDPLIKELVAGSTGKNIPAEGSAAVAVQTATLEALTVVLEKGGAKAKIPASIPSALEAAKELLNHSDHGIREGAAKVAGSSLALLGPEITKEVVDEILLTAGDDSSETLHGKLCATRRLLVSSAGKGVLSEVPNLRAFVLKFIENDDKDVREAALIALGSTVGRSSDPPSSLRKIENSYIQVIEDSRESIEIHRAVATGLATALEQIKPSERIDFFGLKLLDACLKIALSGSQRVQFAFNDVLWLALDVGSGEAGLDKYCSLAVFENERSMKSLHSKVLSRIKEVTLTS